MMKFRIFNDLLWLSLMTNKVELSNISVHINMIYKQRYIKEDQPKILVIEIFEKSLLSSEPGPPLPANFSDFSEIFRVYS